MVGNSLDVFWTMTTSPINTWDIYTIARNNQVGKRRASRYMQKDGTTTYTMYAKPAFYVKSNVAYTGVGTMLDPFVIR